MYKIYGVDKDYLRYDDRVSLPDRINNLKTCAKVGIKNVLYLTRDTYNQSIRYRVDNMIEVIDEMEDWNAISINVLSIEYILPYLDYINLVIMHRVYYDEVFDFISILKKKGLPVIFDIDDYVFHRKCIPIAMEATETSFKMREFMISQYHEVEMLCDGFSVSTGFLENELLNHFNKPVYLIPNFLGRYEQKAADKCYKQKINNPNYQDLFVCTYLSGSSGHNKDFEMVAEQVSEVLEKPNRMMKIIGFLDIPDVLKNNMKNGSIVRRPFVDCCSLIQEVAESDLLIVPLRRNLFSEARSEIKYFLSASVGTPICSSPTYVYRKIASEGMTCCLCNDDEWGRTIDEFCLLNREKIDLNQFHDEVMKHYSFSNQIVKLRDKLESMKDLVL